jgi:metal-responsive CopG/Arc/MetJ family transcriptional regulator
MQYSMLTENKSSKDIVRKKTAESSEDKTKISFDIPKNLLRELDLNRQETQQARSAWVISAIINRLRMSKQAEEEENMG